MDNQLVIETAMLLNVIENLDDMENVNNLQKDIEAELTKFAKLHKEGADILMRLDRYKILIGFEDEYYKQNHALIQERVNRLMNCIKTLKLIVLACNDRRFEIEQGLS